MNDIIDMANGWLTYCVTKDHAHYLTADRASRWNTWLGVPVLVATAIVSTSIFATLESTPALAWKIATGLVSVLAVVLAGLATFLNFAERSQKHRSSSSGYSQLSRRLEYFILRYKGAPDTSRTAALADLEKLCVRLDELDELGLLVPTPIHARGRAHALTRGEPRSADARWRLFRRRHD